MANRTAVRGFLLLGFSEVREVRPAQAAPFLPVYPAGNLLVVAVLDRRLRAPVYFFLGHLALVDLCLVSVTVPKSVLDSLTDKRSISFPGCVAQVFLVVFCAGTDVAPLTVTSHDRYAAIRLPLRYGVIVDRGACGKTAAASWLSRHLLPALLRLVKLSGVNVRELGAVIFTASSGLGCSATIVVPYARIFGAVPRMPAAEGPEDARVRDHDGGRTTPSSTA
ncbi:olfactory receptor 14J1-like [Ornithorhynchus anatinus]|uniref:olfactory receptor 14J1-like n=1 Tax=Ornithorhynchus anatinus TaxID=9258 RepID=UPI0010A87671|nr:olfactory receptor 14J1-like [Ornithorhynchus anatinus]